MAMSSADKLREQFVTVGPGLAMPAKATVTEIVNGFEVLIDVVPEAGRLVAQEVRIRRTDGGPPVTGEAIRSIPVAGLVKLAATLALEVIEHDGYTEWSPRILTPETALRLRENGPTTETLDWVAYLYRLGLLMGEPPTKAVEVRLGIPRSTAGRWVAAARDRGPLGPSEGSGKAGG